MVFLELLSLVEEDNLVSSFSSSSFLLLFLLLLLLLLEAVAVEIPFICRVIRCRVPVAANSKVVVWSDDNDDGDVERGADASRTRRDRASTRLRTRAQKKEGGAFVAM